MNVVKPRARQEVRANFFSVRTCDDWNMIPEEVKRAKSTAHFKKLYNRHREKRPGSSGYGRGISRTRCQRLMTAQCLQNGPSGPDGGIYTSIPSIVLDASRWLYWLWCRKRLPVSIMTCLPESVMFIVLDSTYVKFLLPRFDCKYAHILQFSIRVYCR